MKMEGKTTKTIYKESAAQATALFRRCQGIMIIFLLLCYGAKKLIIFPILNKLWSLILTTIPSSFITEKNIIVLLKYPYVPLAGLILILVFCFATVWELSGIMLCLEYYRQDKPVNLWKLMYLAAVNIKHLIHPKNWLFFVYILLIMPFTDLFSASGMLSSFAIPEYISDFIYNSLPLLFAYWLLRLFLLYIAIRWIYSMPGVLIQGKTFKEARADSVRMLGKFRWLRQLWSGFVYYILRMIVMFALPLAIFALLFFVVMVIFADYDSLVPASSVIYSEIFYPAFTAVAGNYLRMTIMCYLVVNYRVVATEMKICDPPELPSFAVKQRRIYKFRWLNVTIYAVIIGVSVLSLGGLTWAAEE